MRARSAGLGHKYYLEWYYLLRCDKTLANVLGIKPGSPYSKGNIDKRLNYNPTGQDIPRFT
jgi:hypothetical protein